MQNIGTFAQRSPMFLFFRTQNAKVEGQVLIHSSAKRVLYIFQIPLNGNYIVPSEYRTP